MKLGGWTCATGKINAVPLIKILITAVAGLLGLSSSFAAEVTVGFGKNRAPYVMNETNNGISVDLFRAALAHKGHSMQPLYISTNNANAAIHHRVDAISHSTEITSENHFLSDYYLSFKNCIITKSFSGIEIASLEDLTGHRITAWPGAHKYLGEKFSALFSPEHFKEHSPDYFEHESQLAQNQMFWRDRTDIIILDENIFRWYRRALTHQIDTNDSVNFHYLLPQETLVRALFKQASIRDDFNEGIRALRNSGEYQRIVDSYVGKAPSQLEQVIIPRPSESPQASISPTALKISPIAKVASDKNAKMPTR